MAPVDVGLVSSHVVDGNALRDHGQPAQERQRGIVSPGLGVSGKSRELIGTKARHDLDHDIAPVILALREAPQDCGSTHGRAQRRLYVLPQALPGRFIASERRFDQLQRIHLTRHPATVTRVVKKAKVWPVSLA
jgi:hypothetical protein